MPPTRQERQCFRSHLGIALGEGTRAIAELQNAAGSDIPRLLKEIAKDPYLRTCFKAADLKGGFVPAQRLIWGLHHLGHAREVAAWAILAFLERGFLKSRIAGPKFSEYAVMEQVFERPTPAGRLNGPMPMPREVENFLDSVAKPVVLLVCPTSDLEQWWKLSPGAAPVIPESIAPDSESDVPRRRRCYSRDHLFLTWYNRPREKGGRSYARIRDEWNGMTDEDRAKACPAWPKEIERGANGIETVKKALRKAQGESAG